MSESINHTGFVEKIDGDTVFVRITQQSACSGCHAPARSGRFRVNEEVIICGQNSMGLQAVLLAFVIPLVIVVGAIVIGTNLQWDETTSGLTGLSLLLPYYCILYLMRDKLKRRFIFTLKKLN